MKRAIHAASLGGLYGASKGILDLHQLRHGTGTPNSMNMYVDKVTPPPTYVHAAADQGVVGVLLGLGGGVVAQVKDEYDRQQAERRGRNPAGRRDRASSNTDVLHQPRAAGRQNRRASSST